MLKHLPIKIVLAIITLLYPLVVFYGLTEFSVRWLSLVLLLLFLLRLWLLKNNKDDQAKKILSSNSKQAISVIVLLLLLFSFIFGENIGLLFYPVVINSALALVFLYSLVNPPPVIERLARLSQTDLPPHAIRYTRKVTKVWLGFFIINAIIASYTALFTSIATWTLYNGLIAYLLMALLFVGEYLVRIKVQKLNER